MQYMGGKAKIGRKIVEAIIQDGAPTSRWFEPFVGGGNVLEHAAPKFEKCLAMDAHMDLILMWQHAIRGVIFPTTITKELYDFLRTDNPSALRGFVGFGCSFGGKWFGGFSGDHVRAPGGNPVSESSARAVMRQASLFGNVLFKYGDFGSYRPAAGTVFYCDPPYADTTGYATTLDFAKFYENLLIYAKDGAHVYVSGYTIPIEIPHKIIWYQEKRKVLDKKDNSTMVTEFLYKIG